MMGKVIILGAKGRFGRAAMHAFQADHWQVTAFARAKFGELNEQINFIKGDASDVDALSQAASGHDVIINALNPPYEKWPQLLPRLTRNVIEAARNSGATVMVPGNVYNFGSNMPVELTEATPQEPSNWLGRLRTELEEAYAIAADDGVRTIILRGGDFIERSQTGNWFDSQITNKVDKGRVTYPGPLDRVHSWAYLPDMARALVGLANRRSDFAMFETFGFPGYSLTGQALIEALCQVAGQRLKVGSMPWPLLRALSLVVGNLKGVVAMSYLWQVAHRIDGTKLQTALSDWQPTPLNLALTDAIADRINPRQDVTNTPLVPDQAL